MTPFIRKKMQDALLKRIERIELDLRTIRNRIEGCLSNELSETMRVQLIRRTVVNTIPNILKDLVALLINLRKYI